MKLPEEEFMQVARCLKALAHPTRIGILCLLRDGEKTVYELQTALRCTQSNISQHLGVMRERDVLVARKASNQVYYGVKNKKLFQLLDLLQELFCHSKPVSVTQI
jgi:DNA-binding transcriptional ArsR family regulator